MAYEGQLALHGFIELEEEDDGTGDAVWQRFAGSGGLQKEADLVGLSMLTLLSILQRQVALRVSSRRLSAGPLT